MLKVMMAIFGGIVFSLSVYSLITGENHVMPYIMFFFGVMALVAGISELKEKRKTTAVISFLVSAFVLFVSFDTFNVFH
ncbi:MAG: YczI family protein [Psychrobacillus psychrodurans]